MFASSSVRTLYLRRHCSLGNGSLTLAISRNPTDVPPSSCVPHLAMSPANWPPSRGPLKGKKKKKGAAQREERRGEDRGGE